MDLDNTRELLKIRQHNMIGKQTWILFHTLSLHFLMANGEVARRRQALKEIFF